LRRDFNEYEADASNVHRVLVVRSSGVCLISAIGSETAIRNDLVIVLDSLSIRESLTV
jgi:hypothetical protein